MSSLVPLVEAPVNSGHHDMSDGFDDDENGDATGLLSGCLSKGTTAARNGWV
jgi:hypothetical protein